MTEKQFWMKADQISDSHKTVDEKGEAMALLLKTAYDEKLNMVIVTDGNHHVFMNLDDDHPNTIGNRSLLCYTSKRKAQNDLAGMQRGFVWGYVSAYDILNNLFNKAIIGSLTFNCYNMDAIISVTKETLMKHIPGPYPKPDGFIDVPVSGYPVIPQKYRK